MYNPYVMTLMTYEHMKMLSMKNAEVDKISRSMYVHISTHRTVSQVAHGAGVAKKLSKHVRRGLLLTFQHSHSLVTAAEGIRDRRVLKHQC